MDEAAPKKSLIAQEIQELQESVSKAQEKRTHLPQPLFWSLFHHKIQSIRKKKEIQSLVNDILES